MSAQPPSATQLRLSHEVPAHGVVVRLLGFDFDKRQERELELAQVWSAIEHGVFVWIDVEVTEVEPARSLLRELAMVGNEVIEEALMRPPATKLARYDGYLHFAVRACRPAEDALHSDRLDCALGARFRCSAGCPR